MRPNPSDPPSAITAPDGAREVPLVATLILLHDVDEIDHWLSSPRRAELFGPLGMTARTFVVNRERSNRVGLIVEVPNMRVAQEAPRSEAAAEAMKSDGVRPETLVILTEAQAGGASGNTGPVRDRGPARRSGS
jgi:hypothetical protein